MKRGLKAPRRAQRAPQPFAGARRRGAEHPKLLVYTEHLQSKYLTLNWVYLVWKLLLLRRVPKAPWMARKAPQPSPGARRRGKDHPELLVIQNTQRENKLRLFAMDITEILNHPQLCSQGQGRSIQGRSLLESLGEASVLYCSVSIFSS